MDGRAMQVYHSAELLLSTYGVINMQLLNEILNTDQSQTRKSTLKTSKKHNTQFFIINAGKAEATTHSGSNVDFESSFTI